MDLKHFITQSILPLRSSALLYRLANKQIDKDFMLSLKETSVFPLAAVILALEIIIPIEYIAVKKSRDFLFPNIFMDNDNNFKNRQYIDDHIEEYCQNISVSIKKNL